MSETITGYNFVYGISLNFLRKGFNFFEDFAKFTVHDD